MPPPAANAKTSIRGPLVDQEASRAPHLDGPSQRSFPRDGCNWTTRLAHAKGVWVRPPRHIDRRATLAYFFAGAALLALAVLLADAEAALGFSEGLWLQVAVLILLSAFILEVRFTSAATALANAVAVVLLSLGANAERLAAAWWLLLLLAVTSLLLNLGAYSRGATERLGAGPGRRIATKLATQIGGWRALLIPTLALSLGSFNRPFETEWAIGAGVATYALLISGLRPHEVVWALRRRPALADPSPVAGLYPPTGIIVGSGGTKGARVGDVVALSSDWGDTHALMLGPAMAGGGAAWRLFAPDLLSILPDSASSAGLDEVVISRTDVVPPDLAAAAEELAQPGASCAGVLGERSNVRELSMDALPGTALSVGEVVWTRSERGRCYWQVSDASVERSTWSGDTRRAVRATASQIGLWNPDRMGFEVDPHAPIPDALVFRSGELPADVELDPEAGHRIGCLVGSGFPVLLDLPRLGRQHSAILGTTGTGKTHLAFGLVTGHLAAGSKVVCVDLTGQYSARFPSAPVLRSSGDVLTFYADPDADLAVLTPEGTNPIVVLNAVARALLRACHSQGPLEPTASARCVVVVDEAHNFIPETFVINDWDHKAKAQDTSMVLMESRKFGLGFALISQRTAMVTKSALSQCNTVFAFQAVDQTGLDYLEGLCGRTLARSLPTLPHRTAIVMGQALTSNTPIVAYVDQAEVVVH